MCSKKPAGKMGCFGSLILMFALFAVFSTYTMFVSLCVFIALVILIMYYVGLLIIRSGILRIILDKFKLKEDDEPSDDELPVDEKQELSELQETLSVSEPTEEMPAVQECPIQSPQTKEAALGEKESELRIVSEDEFEHPELPNPKPRQRIHKEAPKPSSLAPKRYELSGDELLVFINKCNKYTAQMDARAQSKNKNEEEEEKEE